MSRHVDLGLLLFHSHNTWKSESKFLGHFIFLVLVPLRTEVLHTPSSTWLGFKLMTSKSLPCISCHWKGCYNHSTVSDYWKKNVLPYYLRCLKWFQMHGLSDWCTEVAHGRIHHLLYHWNLTSVLSSTAHLKADTWQWPRRLLGYYYLHDKYIICKVNF